MEDRFLLPVGGPPSECHLGSETPRNPRAICLISSSLEDRIILARHELHILLEAPPLPHFSDRPHPLGNPNMDGQPACGGSACWEWEEHVGLNTVPILVLANKIGPRNHPSFSIVGALFCSSA